MPLPRGDTIRPATVDDGAQLINLWELVFEQDGSTGSLEWATHAGEWFARMVAEVGVARFPVVEVDGTIVATAVGTLELGVPNPHCLRGRSVRLANVITLPAYRGRGYATLLVRDVIEWARGVDADRVDLSTTPAARSIYEKAGFVLTSAPRMKLVLPHR